MTAAFRPNSAEGDRSRAARPPVERAGRLAALGAAPAVIFAAHFFYGATLDLPALVMFAVLSAGLAVALIAPESRRQLAELTPVWATALPFVAVLAIAALTLTPAVPGGSHPIWAWAGLPPAGTLNRSATVIEIFKLMGLGAVFLAGCLLGARAGRARTAFGLILGLGGVYAITSLISFLSTAQFGDGGRLGGGFDLANVAGTQFGVLVLLSAAWAVRQWAQSARLVPVARITELVPTLALLLLFLACLLLTASRGAIAATGLAVALFVGWMALDNRKSRWPLMVVGCILMLSATVLYLQGNTLFVDRFGQSSEGDNARAIIAAAHWQAFLDAPLFGHGLGSYWQVNNQIMTATNAEALASTVVLHNAYLQWLEEAGILGALPMFALVAVILGATAWRAFRHPRNRVLVVGLLSASVLVLAHAAVDVSLNTPSFEAFWALLLGLGFSLSQAPSRGR